MDPVTTSHSVSTTNVDPQQYETTAWAARLRRVSWGAILAGFFCAFALQLMLGLLGLAFGLWSIDPMIESRPLSGLGTGAFLWWAFTGILALFIGGCIASRMSGYRDRVDGLLQGVVVWGLMVMVTFYLANSTLGMVANASAAVLTTSLEMAGQGVNAVGSGIGSAANASAQAVASAAGEGSTAMRPPAVNFEQVGRELNEVLRETGKEQLSPEALQTGGDRLSSVAISAGETILQNPDSVEQQMNRVLNVFYAELGDVRSAVDRDAVVNVITANTDVSREEANRIVTRWQEQYDEASQAAATAQGQLKAQVQETRQDLAKDYQQVKGEVLHAAEETLDSIAYAAFWSFLSMLGGLGAAAVGGWLGPQMLPERLHATHRM